MLIDYVQDCRVYDLIRQMTDTLVQLMVTAHILPLVHRFEQNAAPHVPLESVMVWLTPLTYWYLLCVTVASRQDYISLCIRLCKYNK
jgi:hypothetical protein